jgi:hypothetical protein
MTDAPNMIDNRQGDEYADALLLIRAVALATASIAYAGNNMRLGAILTAAEEFEKWLIRLPDPEPT